MDRLPIILLGILALIIIGLLIDRSNNSSIYQDALLEKNKLSLEREANLYKKLDSLYTLDSIKTKIITKSQLVIDSLEDSKIKYIKIIQNEKINIHNSTIDQRDSIIRANAGGL